MPVPAEIPLAALVFALGMRHGLDPDHLVAIDGLTRSSESRRLQPWTGLFFSLGHGLVVTLLGVALAIAATEWRPPAWVEQFGAALSIVVLLVLGAANIALSLRTPRGARVPAVALRGRWVERLGGASHPAMVAAIGAAFAVSFDTVSHALVFSASGAASAGWALAAALGLVFTAGMVLTDALNGWWVARIIRASDERAARGSRVMSVIVATLCFAIAALAAARLAYPSLEAAASAAAPFIGVATFALLVAAGLAVRRAGTALRL